MVEPTQVKKSNIIHHENEAQFYDDIHIEIFNAYQYKRILKNIIFIKSLIKNMDVCVDVGCGTGNLTGFELSYFKSVVATDISVQMLKETRRKFAIFDNLDLVRCDAEKIPFRAEASDLTTMFSVLHHLPNPFSAIKEMARVLKRRGILYIDHEPNKMHMRETRFKYSSGNFIIIVAVAVVKFLYFLGKLLYRKQKLSSTNRMPKLDYSKTDVHLNGFSIEELTNFFRKIGLLKIVAYSYYWILPFELLKLKGTYRRLMCLILSEANSVIAKLPLSNKLGANICIIGGRVP